MDALLFLRALRRNPHRLRKVDQKGQEQRDGQTQREEALRKPTFGLRTGPVAQEFQTRPHRRERKNRQPGEQEYPWVPQAAMKNREQNRPIGQ